RFGAPALRHALGAASERASGSQLAFQCSALASPRGGRSEPAGAELGPQLRAAGALGGHRVEPGFRAARARAQAGGHRFRAANPARQRLGEGAPRGVDRSPQRGLAPYRGPPLGAARADRAPPSHAARSRIGPEPGRRNDRGPALMDPRLLEYYNSELLHVRESAAEFAREFPKIAGRLAIEGLD